MTIFIVTLALPTVTTVAGILWLAGRWERGRPSNEEIGVPSEILRDLDNPKH